MSPTASQIKTAARTHDWEIRPAALGAGWTIHKDRYKVTVGERHDGGLCWVYLRYPVYDGTNCDYLGPRYRGKLEEVLKFLVDPTCRHPRPGAIL